MRRKEPSQVAAPRWALAVLYCAVLIDTLERVEAAIQPLCGEPDECWIWRPALSYQAPVMNHRRVRRLDGPGDRGARQIRVRSLMAELGRARPLANYGKRGWTLAMQCGDSRCINPGHIACVPVGQLIAEGHARMDAGKRRLRSQRISAAAVGRRVLTNEQVERIRTELDTPIRVLAEEFGVNFSTVQAARSGRNYKDFTASPWAGLGVGA